MSTIAGSVPHKVYDPNLLQELRDHPKVVASRQRRLVSVTDNDRRLAVTELIDSAVNFEIAQLDISSFRTIDFTSFAVAPLTVLFGKNGAGKTSILEAIGHQFESEQQPSVHEDVQEGPQVSLTVRLQTDQTEVESAVLAAYMCLGLKQSLRDEVEDLLARVLKAPVAYGSNKGWVLGIDPTCLQGFGRSLEFLKDHSGDLRGRVIPDLVEAALDTIDSPNPVASLPVRLPEVKISTLSSDVRTLEERLFEQVGSAAEYIVTYCTRMRAHRNSSDEPF